MDRNYIIKENSICRRCLGEGVMRFEGYDFGHGHKQEARELTCTLCLGSGVVVIEKKIEVTISPKMPYAKGDNCNG